MFHFFIRQQRRRMQNALPIVKSRERVSTVQTNVREEYSILNSTSSRFFLSVLFNASCAMFAPPLFPICSNRLYRFNPIHCVPRCAPTGTARVEKCKLSAIITVTKERMRATRADRVDMRYGKESYRKTASFGA